MPRVLVAGMLHEDGLAILRNVPDMDVVYIEDTTTEGMVPHLADAEAILLRGQRLDADLIAGCRTLQFVSRHGVGFDAVDVEALTARGIPLAIVGGVSAQTVAEHAMMLLLAASHRLPTYHDALLPDGDWNYRNSMNACEISGKTLLIVGVGRIGRRVAKMAAGFDITVLGYDPFISGDPPVGFTMVADLRDGLRRADLVSLHMPMAEKPILGAAELALLRPNAVVVNAARGGMIEENALVSAIEEGRVFAAGLDVFAEEPLPPDSRLRATEGIVMTPHAASMTKECAVRIARRSAQNIVDYFAGNIDAAMIVNPAVLDTAAGPD